jgi:hypothetical protein
MTAYGSPAAAGPPAGSPSFAQDGRDWLRLVGGVLLASGALVLEIRKMDEWGDWARLLVLAAPCVLLYVLALRDRRRSPVLEGWQSAFVTFASLLLPFALFQFLQAVDADTTNRLLIALVFAVSAALAIFVAQWAGAWWQMLIGGLYAIVAWLTFWAKVLDEPSPDTIRILLLLAAAILLAAGLVLGRRERPGASDLITVAGIAAILAGAISLAGLGGGLESVADTVSDESPTPSQGWNIYMLLVSLVLIGYGAKSRTRGPAYVGAVGLVVFIGLVGFNLVTQLEGSGEATAVAGWPLVLLIGGLVALVAGMLMGRGDDGVGATPAGGYGGPVDSGQADPTPGTGQPWAGQPGLEPLPGPGRPPAGGQPPPAPPGEQPTQQRSFPGPPTPPGQHG